MGDEFIKIDGINILVGGDQFVYFQHKFHDPGKIIRVRFLDSAKPSYSDVPINHEPNIVEEWWPMKYSKDGKMSWGWVNSLLFLLEG